MKHGGTGRGGGKERERILLTNYVLILANTGIRVGEARVLRWRDIHYDKDRNGSPIVVLLVKGKTGEREVIARDFTKESLIAFVRCVRQKLIER